MAASVLVSLGFCVISLFLHGCDRKPLGIFVGQMSFLMTNQQCKSSVSLYDGNMTNYMISPYILIKSELSLKLCFLLQK